MDEFDFTDGLKIVLVSIFMLGSVQLHALIDESGEHSADRAERLSTGHPAQVSSQPTRDAGDSFEAGEAALRAGPASTT